MPVFRAAPSNNLAGAIQRAMGSANLEPEIEAQAGMAAARTAKDMSLAEKARAEVEQMKRAAADRENPALATQYAGNVAGLDAPTATRLSNHLQGVLEQPGPADIDDAAAVGKEAQPYVTGAPNVTGGQKRGFQTALAALIANRLAPGHTNADQLAQAGSVLNKEGLANEAADTTSVPEANRLIAAATGKIREPFKTNAQGTVLNEEDGTLNEGTQLAGAVRKHVTAQASRASGAASRDFAHAGLYREQTNVLKGGGDEGAPGVPGGTGTKLFQTRDAKDKYAVNEKTGRAWKATEDGWKPVMMTQVPGDLMKFGSNGGAGALNQRFSGRVIGAANEGEAAISSIAKLSDPNSGIFSSKAMGGADGKSILAGAFTPERVKRYNATIAGLAVEIATAQNQGMAPHDKQIEQVEKAITIGTTDDDVTKRYKVALAARYIRKGLEVSMDLANPDQKKRAQGLLERLGKIPDPDEIETDNKGPGMFPNGAAAAAAPKVLAPVRADGWKLMKDAKGNQAYVSPDGKKFEEVPQ